MRSGTNGWVTSPAQENVIGNDSYECFTEGVAGIALQRYPTSLGEKIHHRRLIRYIL